MADIDPIVPCDSAAAFDSDIKAREEAKRERMWDPQVRWRVLQEMIEWADSQQAVPRNTREACLRKQAALLADHRRR